MCKKSLRLMVICFVALFAFSSFALAVDQSQTNRQSLLQQLINFFLKNGRAEVAGTISINGVCGSANGQIFSSTPTTNLCAAGTTSIISGTGPWLWICAGQNGGTTTSCSANKIDIPSIRVISPNGGEQLKIGDTISVSWSISGYESLWDSNLQFVQLQLWNDSGTQFIGSFCTACNSSSAGGNYSWTIGKVFGSSQVDVQPGQYRIRASVVSNTVLSNYALDFSDASFTISQPINGACGSASGHNYLGSDTGWGNYTQCSSGSVSATTFPGPNTIQYWSCYGINGGTTENCSAYRASNTLVNGTCGSANGTTVSSVPTTNLCNAGTVGNILRNALGQWMWQCAGLNGGTTASCLANVKTNTCAVVDGFAMTDLVSNNLPDTIEFWAQATCPNSGSVYDYPIPDGYTLVSCTTDSTLGSHCGCSNCIMSKVKLQKKSTNIINGTCGSANSTTVSSIPTTNLCSAGIASGISGSGPWTWTCNGQNGGTNVSCSTQKKYWIQILTPKAGEVLTQGQTYTMTYSSVGYSPNAIFSVYLSGYNNLYRSLGMLSAGKNSFDFVVPSDLSGTGFQLTIPGESVTNVFSIKSAVTPFLKVISPNGGETLQWGDTYDIAWDSIGMDKVDISLEFGGSGGISLAQNLSASLGKYSWKVDAKATNTNNHKIIISGTNYPNITDKSDNYFSIVSNTNPINGACGSANGTNVSSIPVDNLCSSGVFYRTIGTNSWTWLCKGQNGGTSASCSANKTNPNSSIICGQKIVSINGTTIDYNQKGSSVPLTTINFNWNGTDKIFISGNASGTAKAEVDDILKIKNQTNGKELSFGPFSNAVWSGIPEIQSILSMGGNILEISAKDYYGVNVGSSELYLNCNLPIINGTCGSANGSSLTIMPTTNLCSTGIASGISGSGPWTWTCVGQYGGTTASCSAKKITSTCSTLWWLDSGNKTCQSAKQFCGAYMYQGLKTFNSQEECLSIAKTDSGINFKEKDVAICKEDDKPIIYYFGSTSCPHCVWETPIIDSIVNSFGSYVSYHKSIDNSDDQDIFEQYSTGGIPTIVLGCKYYRIGSGERAGEEAEKAGLKKLICSLTNNQPASVCQSQTYICTEIYNPVCGSDGKTYSNSCKATNAGASVAYKGECGQTTINTSVGTITTSKPLNQMNRQELINFIMILIEALSKKQ